MKNSLNVKNFFSPDFFPSLSCPFLSFPSTTQALGFLTDHPTFNSPAYLLTLAFHLYLFFFSFPSIENFPFTSSHEEIYIDRICMYSPTFCPFPSFPSLQLVLLYEKRMDRGEGGRKEDGQFYHLTYVHTSVI